MIDAMIVQKGRLTSPHNVPRVSHPSCVRLLSFDNYVPDVTFQHQTNVLDLKNNQKN